MEMRFKQRWHFVILGSALILASSQLLHAQVGTDNQPKQPQTIYPILRPSPFRSPFQVWDN